MCRIKKEWKGTKHSGYLYTIEVMIVVAVIIMSVTFIFRYPLTSPDDNEDIIRQYGIDALEFLSYQNLRELVYNDMPGLNQQLNAILPDAIDSTACITCSGVSIPDDRSVVVLKYYLVGYASYSPEVLNVYLWRESI